MSSSLGFSYGGRLSLPKILRRGGAPSALMSGELPKTFDLSNFRSTDRKFDQPAKRGGPRKFGSFCGFPQREASLPPSVFSSGRHVSSPGFPGRRNLSPPRFLRRGGASPPPSCRANSQRLSDFRSHGRRFGSSINSSEDQPPRSSDLPNIRSTDRRFG